MKIWYCRPSRALVRWFGFLHCCHSDFFTVVIRIFPSRHICIWPHFHNSDKSDSITFAFQPFIYTRFRLVPLASSPTHPEHSIKLTHICEVPLSFPNLKQLKRSFPPQPSYSFNNTCYETETIKTTQRQKLKYIQPAKCRYRINVIMFTKISPITQ